MNSHKFKLKGKLKCDVENWFNIKHQQTEIRKRLKFQLNMKKGIKSDKEFLCNSLEDFIKF